MRDRCRTEKDRKTKTSNERRDNLMARSNTKACSSFLFLCPGRQKFSSHFRAREDEGRPVVFALNPTCHVMDGRE